MKKIEVPNLYSSNEYYTVVQFDTKNEWLKARKGCISASDSSCILNLNPYKTLDEYVLELSNPNDKKDKKNSAMTYGTDIEEVLRELFRHHNKSKLDVQYQPNTIIYSKKYPMLSCSLDGLLYEKPKKTLNRKGIYEGKTSYVKLDEVSEWEFAIPKNYYIQMLHQLLVCEDCEFAILQAELKYYNKAQKEYYYVIKEYRIERSDVQADIKFLLDKELEFIKTHANIAFKGQ
jgi:putative phage-type endonuclease